MNTFLRLSALGSELGRRVGAEIDMSFFFADDVRVFDHPRQRQVGAIKKFLELEAANTIDQKAENGVVFPRLDFAAKSFHVAFLIRPAERVGDIDSNITRQARHFSEMIHFLCRRARNNELIQFGRGAWQDVFDVKIGTADFAIRLDRQHPPQQILIFRVLLFEVL